MLVAFVFQTQAVTIVQLPEKFFYALHQQEAGGQMKPKDGDNGRAIGVFQIHRAYWQDAVEYAGLRGSYEDCRNMDYARQIVTAYMNRYAHRAIIENDLESLARCHNAGPNYAKKRALTDKYWIQFKRHLDTRR